MNLLFFFTQMNYKITPNPKAKEIKINFYKDLANTYLKITNFLGFVFINKKVTQSEMVVNLSNRKNGIFYVQITINDITTMEKVIF
jgi:type IX secretion system substrate protein